MFNPGLDYRSGEDVSLLDANILQSTGENVGTNPLCSLHAEDN